MMANIALYQGTRHFEGGMDMNYQDFCACGRGKDRDGVHCQECHLDRVHRRNEIRAVARQRMAVFLAWRERRLAEDA